MLHSLWDFTVSEHMHVIIDADELCTNDHHQLHLRHFFFFFASSSPRFTIYRAPYDAGLRLAFVARPSKSFSCRSQGLCPST